ncbi:MAG: nucleotidyl transferase AbiEii/AbiGii toxin family protein [Gemmatimonadales bacterium]
MKEQLLDIIRRADDAVLGRNLAREYLQARLLLALQDAGAMIPLAFQGGTALRFLFGLPRFSEDLDFALERPDRGFDLAATGKRVTAQLTSEGYALETKQKAGSAVESLMIGFTRVLYEAGLSPHASHALRVRVEVDTNPPAGAHLTTSIVRRHAVLNLQHHDRASLLAGKLHAILARPWVKGRDLFDLFWYLSDPGWPAPNLPLLLGALEQTGWDGPLPDESSWRSVVRDRVASVDWAAAGQDVAPFLEPDPAADLFGRERLLALLRE